jgi:hypothetical protein
MRDDVGTAVGASGGTSDEAMTAEVRVPTHVPAGPGWDRLEDQLHWYDTKSTHHKRWFQSLKVTQIVLAAVIPAGAAAGASAAVAGALGAGIVVLEGLQQLFQFQQNWVSYRATAEALKHEKFLCLAQAGPYTNLDQPAAQLAERVESLVSQEHSAWTSAQRETGDTGSQTASR